MFGQQLGLVVAAGAIGLVISLGVTLTRRAVDASHHFLFGVPFETHLSAAEAIENWRIVLVPALGGLASGIIAYWMRRWRPRDIVDAIEANALHGGRMSLSDSM